MPLPLLDLKDWALELTRSHPLWLFAAIAILPGLGFPSSILLLLAGATWGPNAKACLAAVSAIALNMAWTHALAAGPTRSLIRRFLPAKWLRWLDCPSRNRRQLTLILRITPGIPLFAQNYLLGLLGIPILSNLLISLPIIGSFVCGFVLTGGAIFEGKIGLAITAACLLLAASLAFRLLRPKISPPDSPKP
jgi:uncharacterized membrane protein YdjX (TVP38/TMEM64 family)